MTRRILWIIWICSLVFLAALALNFSPYLRGPAPYPPEWRWSYLFVNTFSRVWAPLFVMLLLLIFCYWIEKTKDAVIDRAWKRICLALVFLFFLLQVSLLFYSRSGVAVMFFKIAAPGMNGYFTTSLHIRHIPTFLHNYNEQVLSYPQHARGHPPGTILFFAFLNKLFSFIPQLKPVVHHMHPARPDMQLIWQTLRWNEQVTALSSGFLISLLSLFAIFPLFLIGRNLYGVRTGIRCAFLYGCIPSVVLFAGLPDVLFAIFPITALVLLVEGVLSERIGYMFIGGLILSLGTCFSLSVAPMLLSCFLFVLGSMIQRRQKRKVQRLLVFLLGCLAFPTILLHFGYNVLSVTRTIMTGVAPRSYLLWIPWNLYDFFLFLGIPLTMLFFHFFREQVILCKKRMWMHIDLLFLTTMSVLLLVDLSGSSRAEVSRIWLPFVPFLLLPIVNYVTSIRNTTRLLFLTVLILEILSSVVYTTVLVLYG